MGLTGVAPARITSYDSQPYVSAVPPQALNLLTARSCTCDLFLRREAFFLLNYVSEMSSIRESHS